MKHGNNNLFISKQQTSLNVDNIILPLIKNKQ